MRCTPGSSDTPTPATRTTSTWWGLSKPECSVDLERKVHHVSGRPDRPDQSWRIAYGRTRDSRRLSVSDLLSAGEVIRAVAAELGMTSAILPSFRKSVFTDQRLYEVLVAFNKSLANSAPSLEQETHFRHAVSLLVGRYTEPGSPKWPLGKGDSRDPAGATISRLELRAGRIPVRTGRGQRQQSFSFGAGVHRAVRAAAARLPQQSSCNASEADDLCWRAPYRSRLRGGLLRSEPSQSKV